MKFDPRYAILAVLLILAVFKITQKETYMCGGKREGYKSASGPKLGRPRPALGPSLLRRKGTVPSAVPVDRFSVNHAPNVLEVRRVIVVRVVCNKYT